MSMLKHGTEPRLREATDKALDAFWQSVVESYPEIKTGDMSIELESHIRYEAERWINTWVVVNGDEYEA
jgi:hypothetical protein